MAHKYTKQQQQEAAAILKRLAPTGSTIFTVLRAVSSSGMSRIISCYVVKDGRPLFLDGYISQVLGYPRKSLGRSGEGLYVTGAGMDMGYHIVHNLSYALYGEGYKLNHEWL